MQCTHYSGILEMVKHTLQKKSYNFSSCFCVELTKIKNNQGSLPGCHPNGLAYHNTVSFMNSIPNYEYCDSSTMEGVCFIFIFYFFFPFNTTGLTSVNVDKAKVLASPGCEDDYHRCVHFNIFYVDEINVTQLFSFQSQF